MPRTRTPADIAKMQASYVTLPPEDYPNQEDYGALTLKAKLVVEGIHDAFLHGDLTLAQNRTGDLFQISYELVKLSSALMIERNNREKLGKKYQPNSKEVIERSFWRSAEAQRQYIEDCARDSGSGESGS